MKNAKNVTLLLKSAFLVLAIALSAGSTRFTRISAFAETENHTLTDPDEIIYYDDAIGEDVYQGGGTQVIADYVIDADEVIITTNYHVEDAPSYGNGNPNLISTCGPITGTNVIVYYDRWSTNLVPNFTPGITFGGVYYYYPDLGNVNTKATLNSLYSLMNIEQIGGTTSAYFKSGIGDYASDKGYSLSYYSFYSSDTNVNATTLTSALSQGKIGVVMCSTYNFIYDISYFNSDGKYHVTKITSTTAHIMMVYGYKVAEFRKNGVVVATETYLNVCSGYSTAGTGLMQLNDYSTINEAIIMYIA